MKIVKVENQNEIFYGELREGEIYRIHGNLYDDFTVGDEHISLEKVRLLAPVEPTKIVCVGRNYVQHIQEMDRQGFGVAGSGNELPERPELFLKPTTAINHPDGDIIYPTGSLRVDFEGEIAVVIKKRAKYVSRDEAKDYILGLTLLNDVSRRDRPKSESQWTSGKSYDTFCPIGPYLCLMDTLEGITIQTYVNDVLKQDSDTEHMIFKIPELIESISARMTLLPGDVIATGTPSGVEPVSVGDVVTLKSNYLGSLTNRFIAEDR